MITPLISNNSVNSYHGKEASKPIIYDFWKRIMQIAPGRMEYLILSRTLSERVKHVVVPPSAKTFFIRHLIKYYLEQKAFSLYDMFDFDSVKYMITEVLADISGISKDKAICYEKFIDTICLQIFNEVDEFVDRRRLNIIFFNNMPFCQECEYRLFCSGKINYRPTGHLKPCTLFAKASPTFVHEFKSLANNRKIEIIDIDISIWQTIIEYLEVDRPMQIVVSEGVEARILNFDEIKDRFIKIRNLRKQFIEASNKINVNYTLYHMDTYEKFIPIAENRNRQFISCQNFNQYLRVSLEEIEAIGATLITEALINQSFIPTSKKNTLHQWKNFTVREALDKHIKSRQLQKNPILPQMIFDLSLDQAQNIYDSDPQVSEEFQSTNCYPIFHRAIMWNRNLEIYSEDSIEKTINDFLSGFGFLDDIITENNALDILKLTKVIEFARKRDLSYFDESYYRTYQIRQRILKLCPSQVTTCEVFTNSLHPRNYTNFEYLIKPENWVDLRVAEQARIVINQNMLSLSLSKRIKRAVVVTRGNTGVGKSYWIKQVIKGYLEENPNSVCGVLNPDCIKALLKKNHEKWLINSQVYAEGRIIFENYLASLTKQKSGIEGAVIDTRLLTIEEFEQVLSFSRLRGETLELIDIDAPIWNSIISVLKRDPFGVDPCVTFDVIKSGFINARKNRRDFIEASIKEKINYSLYSLNPEGEFMLVAQNRDFQFIHSDETFEECLKAPLDDELEAIGLALITQELIASLNMTNENKNVLKRWIGNTVENALKLHSKGIQ